MTGAQVVQALRATAVPLAGETALDQGYGEPRVGPAYVWLLAGHAAPRFRVRALPLPRPTAAGPMPRAGAVAAARPASLPEVAYHRWGLEGAEDTIQRFAVTRLPDPEGQASAGDSYRLYSDQPWLGVERPTLQLGAGGTAQVAVRYAPARLSRPGRYVGVVSAVPDADSAAGTAFRLVSEIIVPDSGQWRTVSWRSRKLSPGQAFRYYVNVPVGAAELAVRTTVPDTSEEGYLSLFEPSGRPSRTLDHRDLGGADGRTGVLAVPSNDLRPGVWEAVVQAVPGGELHYDFQASVPGISIVRVDSTGGQPSISYFSPAAADTTMTTSVEQVGIGTTWQATVERGGPYRRTFAAPAWATGAVVEVQLTPGFWNTVTDFAIVLYDSSGAQLGKGAMNYDFDRVTVDLPEKRDAAYRVTVELFPAFAHFEPPANFGAIVRLAFTGAAPPPVHGVLTIPSHGTAVLAIPPFASRAPSPDWWDLVRVKLAGSDSDWVAIERLVAVREQ